MASRCSLSPGVRGTLSPEGLSELARDRHGIEGLRETRDGPQRERPLRLFALSLCRQKDDRNLRRGRIFLEAAARFVTIETGHHPVEQDRVEWCGLRVCQRLGARGDE